MIQLHCNACGTAIAELAVGSTLIKGAKFYCASCDAKRALKKTVSTRKAKHKPIKQTDTDE